RAAPGSAAELAATPARDRPAEPDQPRARASLRRGSALEGARTEGAQPGAQGREGGADARELGSARPDRRLLPLLRGEHARSRLTRAWPRLLRRDGALLRRAPPLLRRGRRRSRRRRPGRDPSWLARHGHVGLDLARRATSLPESPDLLA